MNENNNTKEHRFTFRVSKNDWAKMQENADKYCMSVANYLRQVALTKKPRVPKIKQIDVSSMNELKRQGGNLKNCYNILSKAIEIENEQNQKQEIDKKISINELIDTQQLRRILDNIDAIIAKIVEEYRD